FQVARNCSLESTEAKIESTPAHCARQPDCFWISKRCQTIDRRSGWITEPQHLANFIECLSSRIVAGTTKQLVCTKIVSQNNFRVASRNEQCQMGKIWNSVCIEKYRTKVSLEVIHPDQRKTSSKRDCLGRLQADQ